MYQPTAFFADVTTACYYVILIHTYCSWSDKTEEMICNVLKQKLEESQTSVVKMSKGKFLRWYVMYWNKSWKKVRHLLSRWAKGNFWDDTQCTEAKADGGKSGICCQDELRERLLRWYHNSSKNSSLQLWKLIIIWVVKHLSKYSLVKFYLHIVPVLSFTWYL